MSANIGKELEATLAGLRELINDEQIDNNNRNELLKAYEKVTTTINELVSENEMLKSVNPERASEDLCIVGESAMTEVAPQIVRGKEAYLKVKFLLKKCKELYELFRDYDSPSDALLRKKRNIQKHMSCAVKPFQDVARKLCRDGVLEDVSFMLVELCSSSKRAAIGDPIQAIAQYVSKKCSARQRDLETHNEVKEDAKLKRGDKNIQRCMRDYGINEFVSKHPYGKKGLNKKDEFFSTLNTDVPNEATAAVYMNYQLEMADKFERLAFETPADERSQSCENFVENLGKDGDEKLDSECVRFAQGLLCDERKEAEPRSKALAVHSFSSRLLTPHFPKLADRKEYFAEPPTVEPLPTVRRYRPDDHREPENLVFSYAKEKRLNLEPSGKTRERALPLLEPGQPTRRDEELKPYMERINHARLERLERFGYPNYQTRAPTPPSDYLQNTVRITIPPQNGDLLRKRMLNSERRYSGVSGTWKKPPLTRSKSKPDVFWQPQ